MLNVKRPEEYEQCLSPCHQYDALLELKSDGLISHILLSSHLTGSQTSEIIEDGKIEGVLLNINILNFPNTLAAAKKAKMHNIGVGAMSPLAGGLIPKYESKFSFLANNEKGPIYNALQFVASLPWIDFFYLATNSRKELEIANDVADHASPLGDEEISLYRKIIGEGLPGVCTSCMYCAEACPQSIPVPAYMEFYNNKVLFDFPDEELRRKLDFARKWFMLANRNADATACTGYWQCEEECTQNLDIANRMQFLANIEVELVSDKPE